MVDPLGKNPLNICIQKAMVVFSEVVLQLMEVDIMRGNPNKLDNQPKRYREFINDCKLYHTIIGR